MYKLYQRYQVEIFVDLLFLDDSDGAGRARTTGVHLYSTYIIENIRVYGAERARTTGVRELCTNYFNITKLKVLLFYSFELIQMDPEGLGQQVSIYLVHITYNSDV